jgi:hypothetical protein
MHAWVWVCIQTISFSFLSWTSLEIIFYFLFFSILWCGPNGDHPKNNLAKFGYKQIMNLKTYLKSFYILGYLLEPDVKSRDFFTILEIKDP